MTATRAASEQTTVVDGGVRGAYALGQLTGPGDLRDIMGRLVRLLLLLLKAHTRKTSLLLRPVSNFFEEICYGYSRADETAGA